MPDPPLLIIKTGSAVPTLDGSLGDFEDWIGGGLNLESAATSVVRVDAGQPLPAPDSVCGAVVTGSSAMVSSREEWSERTAAWLATATAAGLPILGICYGHQLLAHALGGIVDRNPSGREIGSVTVHLTDAAAPDRLLGGLPSTMVLQETHLESVLELPQAAVRLARSDLDPNQAFRVGERAWGVQFHPEFTAEVTRGYLAARRADLEAEGLHVDRLMSQTADTPWGERILRRFAEIATAFRAG